MSTLNAFAVKPGKPVKPAPTFEIGEAGPSGGIVFHISDGGGSRFSGQHGLEVALVDHDTQPAWGCSGYDINEARGLAVGTGAKNTSAFLAGCAESVIAAELASVYEFNGFDDWFLPSREELNLMYRNLHSLGLGGFSADRYLKSESYWSSTEDESGSVWCQSFVNGEQFHCLKPDSYRVRAVRAF